MMEIDDLVKALKYPQVKNELKSIVLSILESEGKAETSVSKVTRSIPASSGLDTPQTCSVEDHPQISDKLEHDLEIAQRTIEDLRMELASLKEAASRNEASLFEAQRTQAELESLKATTQSMTEIHSKYERLSEQSKVSLMGVFTDTTPTGLLCCGVQEKNISSFWDYLKSESVKEHNDETERVKDLFLSLFKSFRLAFPMFDLISPQEMEMFDTQWHIKHNSSQGMNGPIQRVLLPGYFNTKTKKVLKQAIVVI